MSRRETWSNKVEFAAKRLAEFDGKIWDRLPETSRWLKSRSRYRHTAQLAIGSGNLWDLFHEPAASPHPPAGGDLLIGKPVAQADIATGNVLKYNAK